MLKSPHQTPLTSATPCANPYRTPHGGRRRPMCDPEGCATVLGAVGGGGGAPPPWLIQTLGVGGSGGQPPGSPGGGR